MPKTVEPGSLLDLAKKGKLTDSIAKQVIDTADRPGGYNARQVVKTSPRATEELQHETVTLFDSGVDFSYSISAGTASCLRANRGGFVCVYEKWNGGGSVGTLRNAGLRVVPIFEIYGTEYRGGFPNGVAHGQAHQSWCNANGFPGAEGYFAIDEDAWGLGRVGAVGAYADGIASVIGRGRTNIYASNQVISWLLNNGKINRGWVTYAWSGGGLDERTTLYQNPNNTSWCGVSTDNDRAFQSVIGAIGESGPGPTPTPPKFHPSGGQEDRSKVAIATRPAPGNRAIDIAVVGNNGHVYGAWAVDPLSVPTVGFEDLGVPSYLGVEFPVKSVSLAWTQDGIELIISCHASDDGMWTKIFDNNYNTWLNAGVWQKNGNVQLAS